jgi:hypothetical protein
MKKQLMVGLLSAGLAVAMLPGLTVAKDDGKSDCKKGDWTDWVREDGSAFADQGECVAYVAEGGTLNEPTPPTPFGITCLGQGGQYEAPYEPYWNGTVWGTYPEGCYWDGIDYDTWWNYFHEVVGPTCTTGAVEGGYWGWSPAWVACAVD